MQTPVVLKDKTVDYWEYFLDDEPIGERDWLDKLKRRRQILKSISTN